MKRYSLLFILSYFIFNLSVAQSTDSIIKNIRVKYQLTNDNLNKYDTTMVDIWGESTDGAFGIAYYEGQKLKLIEVMWFGENGKATIQYYFNEGKLFFAFNTDYKYNRPFYWDEKKAKENNDTEVFDTTKTIIKEDRYYFQNEKLIRWLDNNKNEVDLLSGTNSIVGQGLIAHAYEMIDKLKK